MSKPTFDDVRKAVLAVKDRLGLDVARGALERVCGVGTKLADLQGRQQQWANMLTECARIELENPPRPVQPGRPLVKHSPGDVPPNALAVTLYLPEDLYFRLDKMRPDEQPMHVFLRGILDHQEKLERERQTPKDGK